MKKSFLTIVLLSFLLTACGISIQNNMPEVENFNAENKTEGISLNWIDPEDDLITGVLISYIEETSDRKIKFESDEIIIGKSSSEDRTNQTFITGLEENHTYVITIRTVTNKMKKSDGISTAPITWQKPIEEVIEPSPIVINKYFCPICEEQYESLEEAKACCELEVITETIVKYKCPRCDKVYDTTEETLNCCGPITITNTEIQYVSALTSDITNVKYYLQTEDLQSYEFIEAETKSLPTGTQLEQISKCYNGFTAKGMSINGDILNVYYDRISVTLSFFISDTDTKVFKTQTGIYGTKIEELPIPTKQGYHFNFWTLDNISQLSEESKYPSVDTIYVANWSKEILISYYTEYDQTPLTLTKYEGYVIQDLDVPQLSDTQYSFDGWYDEETPVIAGYQIVKDTTLTAKWILRNQVSAVTFSVFDNTIDYLDKISLTCSTQGSSIYYTIDGTEPTKESILYTTPIEITQNCVIKAFAVKDTYIDSNIVTKNLTIKTYKVTYNLGSNTNGTVPMDSNLYKKGDTVTLKAEVTYTDNYFFGWEQGENLYQPEQTITVGTSDITFTAKYAQNVFYSTSITAKQLEPFAGKNGKFTAYWTWKGSKTTLTMKYGNQTIYESEIASTSGATIHPSSSSVTIDSKSTFTCGAGSYNTFIKVVFTPES